MWAVADHIKYIYALCFISIYIIVFNIIQYIFFYFNLYKKKKN